MSSATDELRRLLYERGVEWKDFDVEKGLAMALCRKVWGRAQTGHFLKKVEEQA